MENKSTQKKNKKPRVSKKPYLESDGALVLPGHNLKKIPDPGRILHITADDNKINIELVDGSPKISEWMCMKDIFPLLGTIDYIQIHKSHVVKKEFILGCRRNKREGIILLKKGQSPVSRSYLPKVLDECAKTENGFCGKGKNNCPFTRHLLLRME